MPAWPADLPPKPLSTGWSEQPQPNVDNFQPAVGASKRRRLSTASGATASAQFKMTDAQLASFWVWFAFDIADGSVPYEWAHPRSGQIYYWTIDDMPASAWVAANANSLSLKLTRLP